MSAYLEHHFDASDTAEQQLFSDLLQEQDPLIMSWLNDPASADRYEPVIRKIRDTLTTRA